MLNYFKKLLTISAVLVSIHATAQEMNIQLAQKGHAVDQSLYGIFFEEINHAGDGGLYAELLLVYASPEQLRSTPMLSLQNHPLAYKVSLCGLVPNSDGLYRLDDLESRFIEAINAY